MADKLLLEGGAGRLLLEDGVSFLELERTGESGASASLPHLGLVLNQITNYTLPADQGTYTITNSGWFAAQLFYNPVVPAEQGTYSVTGYDVTLNYGNILAAEQGTYSITGQDAGMLYGRVMEVDQGEYDLITDAETFLLYSEIVPPDTPAPFPHLGMLAGLGYTPVIMAADYGAYTLTGQDIGTSRNYIVAADQGAYSGVGQVAILQPGGGGSSGNPASLPSLGLFPVSGINRTLTCDPGTYSILGSEGIPDFAVTAEHGTYDITGQDAGLFTGWRLDAEQGTYSITGQDSEYFVTGADRSMAADYGTYDVTGQDAGVFVGYPLSAEQGFYGFAGQATILSFGAFVGNHYSSGAIEAASAEVSGAAGHIAFLASSGNVSASAASVSGNSRVGDPSASELGYKRRKLDPFPRFPSDPAQTVRKLTDLHRDIAEVVNKCVDGKIDVLLDSSDLGLVLKGPSGHYWRVKIDDAGALSTTDIGTTRP